MSHLTLGGSIQQRPALSAVSSAPLVGGTSKIEVTKPNPWQSGKVLSGDEWHQAKAGMTFNAWDQSGKMHTQQYTPSETTSTSRSNVYETTSVASPVAPSVRVPPARESKWAKPVSSLLAGSQYLKLTASGWYKERRVESPSTTKDRKQASKRISVL